MCTLDREPDGEWLHTKGAPEAVLPACTRSSAADGTAHPLGSAETAQITERVAGYAQQGLRVLALARRLASDRRRGSVAF